jgi:hypothetical protein
MEDVTDTVPCEIVLGMAALEKRSSFKITKGTKEHFSHPVIKNGILYQRRGDVLMAFNISAKQEFDSMYLPVNRTSP